MRWASITALSCALGLFAGLGQLTSVRAHGSPGQIGTERGCDFSLKRFPDKKTACLACFKSGGRYHWAREGDVGMCHKGGEKPPTG